MVNGYVPIIHRSNPTERCDSENDHGAATSMELIVMLINNIAVTVTALG